MAVGRRQQAIRAMRGQMWSPGRPSVARREDRQRFWRAIAAGRSTEDSAGAAGVSVPVGTRWFRDGGGMSPISLAPASERYLSFAEPEQIAHRLPLDFPDDPSMRISHEAIYQSLYVQAVARCAAS